MLPNIQNTFNPKGLVYTETRINNAKYIGERRKSSVPGLLGKASVDNAVRIEM